MPWWAMENGLRDKMSRLANLPKRKPGVFVCFVLALPVVLLVVSLLLVPECKFLGDFTANFLSDFLVGVVLAWWLAGQLDLAERRLDRERERKERLRKVADMLQLLNTAVKTLETRLPDHIKHVEKGGQLPDLWMLTSFWDVVRRGGELLRLLDTPLLFHVSLLYSELDRAKRTGDLLLQLRLNPDADISRLHKEADMVRIILESLKRAQSRAPTLLLELQWELQAVGAELPQDDGSYGTLQ